MRNKYYGECFEECLVNLSTAEISAVYTLVDKVSALNVLTLLTKPTDDIIDNEYTKYALDGTYSLQSAIGKIHSTLSNNINLLDTYNNMLVDTYTFYKGLLHVIDSELYNLYITQGNLNIADNLKNSFFKLVAYNINNIRKNNE